MNMPISDVIQWLVLPLAGWGLYKIHELTVEVRAIRVTLDSVSDIHRRHEAQIEDHERRLNQHGENIALLIASK
jgi:hypothetical protein